MFIHTCLVGELQVNERCSFITNKQSPTVDGRNPFRTVLNQWEALVCWYLQGNRNISGFLRRRKMVFVHPHNHHDSIWSQTRLGFGLVWVVWVAGTRDTWHFAFYMPFADGTSYSQPRQFSLGLVLRKNLGIGLAAHTSVLCESIDNLNIIWVNYNDLTRPHPKWWFMWGIAPQPP